MTHPQPAYVNRSNFGKQVLAARAIHPFTRVQLASAAQLSHTKIKLIEEGSPDVAMADLVKVVRVLEEVGFEFLHGTESVSLAHYPDPADQENVAITIDPTMPDQVRRIYPRTLDPRGLLADLLACGVVVEGKEQLLDLCGRDKSWPDTFTDLAERGHRYGIRFFWDELPQDAAVRRLLHKLYGFDAKQTESVVANILQKERA